MPQLSQPHPVTPTRELVFTARGVTKVRLTGGEPLLRREIERLVAMIRAIDGISDKWLNPSRFEDAAPKHFLLGWVFGRE